MCCTECGQFFVYLQRTQCLTFRKCDEVGDEIVDARPLRWVWSHALQEQGL